MPPYAAPAPSTAEQIRAHAKEAVTCVLVETADGCVTEFRPTGKKDTARLSITPGYEPKDTRVVLELLLSSAERTAHSGPAWTHYNDARCRVADRTTPREQHAERAALPRTEHGREYPSLDYRFVDSNMPSLVFVTNGPEHAQARVWTAGANHQVPEDRRSRALLRAMLTVGLAELDEAEAREVAA